MREVILAADDRVTEGIEWQAPTFVDRGTIASFHPKATKHVSLVFHTGASLPYPQGLVPGEGEISRVARFEDADDLAAKTPALQGLIGTWIASKG